MSFPPFILPCFTVNKRTLTTDVQSVVEPCNIAVYLHSKKLYFHSISRLSCNKYIKCTIWVPAQIDLYRTRAGAETGCYCHGSLCLPESTRGLLTQRKVNAMQMLSF